MTKTWPLALALLAACGSKARLDRVPVVNTASVIVADPGMPPPVLVIVDEAGKLHVNARASWDELAASDPMIGAHPVTDLHAMERLLAESRGMLDSAADDPP